LFYSGVLNQQTEGNRSFVLFFDFSWRLRFFLGLFGSLFLPLDLQGQKHLYEQKFFSTFFFRFVFFFVLVLFRDGGHTPLETSESTPLNLAFGGGFFSSPWLIC